MSLNNEKGVITLYIVNQFGIGYPYACYHYVYHDNRRRCETKYINKHRETGRDFSEWGRTDSFRLIIARLKSLYPNTQRISNLLFSYYGQNRKYLFMSPEDLKILLEARKKDPNCYLVGD